MLRGSMRPCPFGLDVPSACETIGDKIYFMPLKTKDKRSMSDSFARIVLSHSEEKSKCPFADIIIYPEDNGGGIVDCKYGSGFDVKPLGNNGIPNSSLYPWFHGDGYRELGGAPLTHSHDDNNSHDYAGWNSIYTDIIRSIL
jgi:hypothetical protein